MNEILPYWPAILAALAYIGTALISTMPDKGTVWNFDTWYGWFYDFCHMILNSRGQKIAAPTKEKELP